MGCTMSTSWKSAAIALIALVLAAPPVRAQDSANPYGAPFSADNGYGPPPGYGSDYSNAPQCNPANYGPDQVMPPACMPQAYCDQYGCPDDFYDMPIWYGPVFYDNVWVTGPVYYRVWHGLRQYWIHGGWHYDAWIGPRPSWWNAALYHTGPALGRNYHLIGRTANATNSIRVWRGTQASTYRDGGSGQFYSRGLSDRATASGTTERAINRVSFRAPDTSHQMAPQYHFSGNSSSLGARNHNSGSGGHHGHTR